MLTRSLAPSALILGWIYWSASSLADDPQSIKCPPGLTQSDCHKIAHRSSPSVDLDQSITITKRSAASASHPRGKGINWGPDNGYATSTLYHDTTGGACGCYNSNSAPSGYPQQWLFKESNTYVAAASAALFERPGDPYPRWKASGCGKCYKLSSQGYAACPTCGRGTAAGTPNITVVVDDLCPPGPTEKPPFNYCSPYGQPSKQGYYAHFDLHSQGKTLGQMQWDNPVVYYERVDCPTDVMDFFSQKCKAVSPEDELGGE